MNAAIAQHLNVAQQAIIKIEEWKHVLFVVIKGIGARFVSKKVAKVSSNRIDPNDFYSIPGKLDIGEVFEAWGGFWKVREIEFTSFAEAGDFSDEDSYFTNCKLDQVLGEELEMRTRQHYPILVERETDTGYIVYIFSDSLPEHFRQIPEGRYHLESKSFLPFSARNSGSRLQRIEMDNICVSRTKISFIPGSLLIDGRKLNPFNPVWEEIKPYA